MNARILWTTAAIGAALVCAPAWAQGTGPAPYGQQSATPASSTAAPSSGKSARKNGKGSGAKQGGSGSAPRANAAEDTGAQHSN